MKGITIAAFAAALLLSLTGAFAASKVTAGVGHMCCAKCQAAATSGLAKVADGSDVMLPMLSVQSRM